MNILIGMTDFVLEQNKNLLTTRECFINCLNYANFLEQPLELWMFVPCKLIDGFWVVLEEPEPIHTCGLEPDDYEYNDDEAIEYRQAKERCLFEGFEFTETHMKGIDSNLNLFVFPYANNRFGLTKKQEAFMTWFQLFTIEDLVQCDLQITPTAQKQIGI